MIRSFFVGSGTQEISVEEVFEAILQKSSPLPEPLSPLSDPLTAMSKAIEAEYSGDHADSGMNLSWFEQLDDEATQENRATEPDAETILTHSKRMQSCVG